MLGLIYIVIQCDHIDNCAQTLRSHQNGSEYPNVPGGSSPSLSESSIQILPVYMPLSKYSDTLNGPPAFLPSRGPSLTKGVCVCAAEFLQQRESIFAGDVSLFPPSGVYLTSQWVLGAAWRASHPHGQLTSAAMRTALRTNVRNVAYNSIGILFQSYYNV